MAKSKSEQAALREEQRRQQSSVVDLAREGGMKGNRPGGTTVSGGKVANEPKEDK